jgi:signal transduction histidine kinase
MTILIMYLTFAINSKRFPVENIVYALLLSAIIYATFLVYEYYSNNSFYKQIHNMLQAEGNFNYLLNAEDAKTSEQKAYIELLSKIYKRNSEKVSEYDEQHREYIYFINQWVHQMKTPVSIINLILQDEKSEDYKATFSSIGEENEKISSGLDMMLSHARLNEFNLDFKVESVNIISVVRKVINHNKKSLIHNFIFPKVQGEENIMVETDEKWIYFVINQIFINAIKYSREAVRENKYIVFNIESTESKVILSISDQGIGIPKEDISRVFQAFFTGKNGRRTSESTGMGMYLSKRVCDKLGHGLTVDSQEGQWSKFSIVFHRERNIFTL